MAKLHFRYGVMGGSKTADALMLAYNFREKGKIPLLAKPMADTRTEKMWSRVGIEAECVSLESICECPLEELSGYDCVIIDEVQFATAKQVDRLVSIADILNIPVFAYGLRTGYTGHLFEGSKRLFEVADELEESKTICWCGASAKMNALLDDDGNVVTDPNLQTDTALQGHFVSLCRKHFNERRLH